MTKVLILAAALLCAGSALATAHATDRVAFPAWLDGAWTEARADGAWADEYWTPPRGDIMLGVARIGDAGRLGMFEYTRIVRTGDGTLVFIAQPRGGAPAEFPLVADGARMVEFANPAHDYPQRIRYWREGRELRARTSLMDGSKPMDWRYQPMLSGVP